MADSVKNQKFSGIKTSEVSEPAEVWMEEFLIMGQSADEPDLFLTVRAYCIRPP